MIPRPSRPRLDFMEYVFLWAFIFWSLAGLVFTLGCLTPATVGNWPLPTQLRDFVDLCIYTGDPILIYLAFINTHLHAARQWTDGIARNWAVKIVICAYVIEYIGTWTSIPFGDYHYTERFGTMLGPVPIVIPLAWHVILTNALFLVRAISAHSSGFGEALVAGVICMAYDYVLEPFATTVKGYWIWTGGSVPLLNYISWLLVSALLIRAFAPAISTRYRYDLRPWLIVAFTLMIFIAGETVSRFYK